MNRGRSTHRIFSYLSIWFVVAAPLLIAENKPDFSGLWQWDKAKSHLAASDSLSPTPPPDDFAELIDHQGPRLTITDLFTDPEGERKSVTLTLTTDGQENVIMLGPMTRRSRTRWEGTKLVTVWRVEHDGAVAEGEEIRHLSGHGKIQMLEFQNRFPKGETRGSMVFRRSRHLLTMQTPEFVATHHTVEGTVFSATG